MAKTTSSPKATDSAAKKSEDSGKKLVSPNTKFELQFKSAEIDAAKQKVLQKAQQSVKAEGFRKGFAPLSVVEKRLDERELREMIIREVFPKAYVAHITAEKISPLVEPNILIREITPEAWIVEVEVAEAPKVVFKDYEKKVDAAKKASDLWKTDKKSAEPKTADEKAKQETADRQAKIRVVVQAVLEAAEVPIPELLLQREVEERLHNFMHELEHLRIDLAKYLAGRNMKQEDFQQEVAVQALFDLQVEFALAKIAEEKKLSVTPQEVEKLLEHPESVDASQKIRLQAALLKQKTIDSLLTE